MLMNKIVFTSSMKRNNIIILHNIMKWLKLAGYNWIKSNDQAMLKTGYIFHYVLEDMSRLDGIENYLMQYLNEYCEYDERQFVYYKRR